MAFNNGSIIELCNTIRNRDLTGEDFTADEWSAIITSNSQKLFAKLLGVPNLYQLNAPIERRGANVSRRVDEKLSPFFNRDTEGVVGGSVDLSSKSLGYLLAINPSTVSGRPFTELQPYRIADVLGSAVIAPTEDDPAFTWSSPNSILVYPSTVPSVVIHYYEFPTDAVVAFTINSTTLLKEYDESSSTETGWGDNELVEIAYMCLRDLGINMERNDVTQYAQNIVANE